MTTTTIRRARRDDASAMTRLINDAYEVERALLEGKRTSLGAIEAMLACEVGQFFVIDGTGADEESSIAACVHTELQVDAEGASGATVAYLGLLSVRPGLQRTGYGRRLVEHVADQARAAGCRAVTITVVSERHELFPYYAALGFVRTGVQPYRDPTAVRVPGLHLVRMRRVL